MPTIAAGQPAGVPSIRIASTMSCKQCRLRLEPASIQLVGPEGQDVSPRPTYLFASPTGRMITPRGSEGLPLVFSAAGRFEWQLGRIGGGPGEYRNPVLAAFGPADSIAVLDGGTGRISILSKDLRFVRSFRVDGQPSAFEWLRDGAFVVAADVRTAGGIGYPLHILGPDGKVIKNLGTEEGPVGSKTPFRNRLLAKTSNGFYLADAVNRITVEYWEGLRLSRRWEIDSPFFPDDGAADTKRPFGTRLTSIFLDSNGVLFLLTTVPRPRWRDGIRSHIQDGEEIIEIVDRDKMMKTVIEAVDLKTGQNLARLETDHVIQGFISGGYTYRHVVSEDGVAKYELRKLRLY